MKRYRLERHWTLRKIAGITGLTLVSIWKIENAKVIPTELTMAKLIDALPGLLDSAA